MFFKHCASKNQLPGFSINGTLGENGLIYYITQKVAISWNKWNSKCFVFETFEHTVPFKRKINNAYLLFKKIYNEF